MLVTVLIFMGIYILGYLIAIVSAMLFGATEPYDVTYYNVIIFSILYLSGIVSACTYLILKRLKK